jgi:Flp pilus assembly pilin Flp
MEIRPTPVETCIARLTKASTPDRWRVLVGLQTEEIHMINQMFVWVSLFVHDVRRRVTGKDDVGASMVEYALLLALIAVVAIGALMLLGHTVNNTLLQVGNSLNSTNNVPAP